MPNTNDRVTLAPHRNRPTKVAKFLNTWRSNGAISALRDVKDVLIGPIYRRIDRNFDRKYNVDTYQTASLANLTVESKWFNRTNDKREYASTDFMTFKGMMSLMPKDLSEYVFIDIGSGKGKVLLMASDYNFRRIIGVEFAKELHAVAERNIKMYSKRNRRCYHIDAIMGDAVDFLIPNEKCVFYLFHPFMGSEDLMARVLSNIADSYAANPRKMYCLYLNPRHSDTFKVLDFMRVVERRRFASRTAIIYESVI